MKFVLAKGDNKKEVEEPIEGSKKDKVVAPTTSRQEGERCSSHYVKSEG